MYVFIQVSPIEQRFERVIGYTTDLELVNRVKDLVKSNDAFLGSFTRLTNETIHSIAYQDKEVVEKLNKLLSTNLDIVDELIIQPIMEISYDT